MKALILLTSLIRGFDIKTWSLHWLSSLTVSRPQNRNEHHSILSIFTNSINIGTLIYSLHEQAPKYKLLCLLSVVLAGSIDNGTESIMPRKKTEKSSKKPFQKSGKLSNSERLASPERSPSQT